ncbi:ZNF706 isoform 7 [Pan troglodytes]|uniref:ZNF706 isoform 7 n=2 Tax=Hominidae TaxID=9604 RepID=A0A2J8UFI5_PONAB|nr:ZNF706 isoform 7 [Pan troglodytes]PNJ44026.1 ZNF706 isoform 7 [Pongo abelii]
MARGQQKIQSQQKNAKKQAGQKKKQGHDQKAAAKAALIYTCTVCRSSSLLHNFFVRHKCQTLRPSSSTLRASILRLHFLQN